MVKCICCGKMFDPKEAEELYDIEFDDMWYEDDYPEYDTCFECARNLTYEGLSAGGTIIHLMGPGNAPWE